MKELTPVITHDVYILHRNISGDSSPPWLHTVYISSIKNSPGERIHPCDYTQRVYSRLGIYQASPRPSDYTWRMSIPKRNSSGDRTHPVTTHDDIPGEFSPPWLPTARVISDV